MISRFVHSIADKFPYKDSKLDLLFDTLDLEVVLSCMLNWMAENIEAKNVVWMRADECTRLMDQAHGITKIEPDQNLYRQVRFNSVNKIEESEVLKRIWFFHGQPVRPELHVTNGLADVLVPVIGKDQKPLGYLFIWDVPRFQKARTLQKMNWFSAKIARHLQFAFEHWLAKSQSFCDDLTGLYNQRFMANVLESEINRCSRIEGKFTVLFLDIDHFKAINDTKGHWIGSKVLIELARVIQSQLRRSDYAFRYGGDEFVMVLPDTGAEGGRIAAERIREMVASTDFLIDGVHLRMTVSVGLAAFPEHAKTHREIIRMADEAMYCGKHKSRNIVFVANS